MRVPDLPLAAFERFRTRDLHEARGQVESLLSAHRVEPKSAGTRFDVRYHSVDLPESSIIYAQYGGAVRLVPGLLDGFYLVGVPLAGISTVSCGGRTLVTHAGMGSVQSCTTPVSTEWQADCRKLSVKIGRAALERRLAEMLGYSPPRPIVFDLELDLQRGRGLSWRRLIELLLSELSPGSMYLASAVARRALEDTILSTLLLAQQHTYSEELLTDTPRLAPRHVRRAEQLIAQDPALPHRPAELAAQLGVSVRSLQAAFRQFRGMTPTQFVRGQRLAKARADLLKGPSQGTVTEIALAAGYRHLGRFARDYRARHGESPSQTQARSRP
jgi:AraC-like DNA-binding protein